MSDVVFTILMMVKAFCGFVLGLIVISAVVTAVAYFWYRTKFLLQLRYRIALESYRREHLRRSTRDEEDEKE